MIRATEGIVADVCLLADCKVVNGLPDEDIVKDASCYRSVCRKGLGSLSQGFKLA
jgi:hypothetical protein